VLVIDIDGSATGIIVDRVSEVLTIQTSDIEEPPRVISGIDADFLEGVVKLDGGRRLIMDLDLPKVLKIENFEDHAVQNSVIATENVREIAKELSDEKQLVSFVLGEEEYGLDIMRVKEIIRMPEIVHVPKAPFGVEGVVSIRSNLLPILNLRRIFGLEDVSATDSTRILVVDIGDISAGIMVDCVSEVMRVPAKVIDETPAMLATEDGDQISGVAKLEKGDRLILILDPDRILSRNELKMVTKIKGIQKETEEANVAKQLIDEEQLVTFRLGAEEYAIKITLVQEINRMTEITRVPKAPSYIEGIVNLRGNVIPALDLRKRFSMDTIERTDSNRIIIVDIGGVKTGIIVDAVSEVLRLERSAIAPPPAVTLGGIETSFIEGVGKLNNGQRMVMILNLPELLSLAPKAEPQEVKKVVPEAKKAASEPKKPALKKAGPKH
jgi:purine-binding chemotaxis protein CheW